MPTLTRLMALMAALGLIAGCAASPAGISRAPTTETYMRFAGPPIDSFTYLGRYEGFRALGGNDLIIWTTVNDAYLIRVLPPCVQLPFAGRVELTSALKTVTRNFDFVVVDGDRCHIDSIRHVDYGAMKQAHLAPP